MLKKNSKTDDAENEAEKLQEKLQEIKGQEGIIGYIWRGSKSASIDLKDPTKIIEYAMLSSEVQEVGKKMKENLDLGDLENIILESNDKKLV